MMGGEGDHFKKSQVGVERWCAGEQGVEGEGGCEGLLCVFLSLLLNGKGKGGGREGIGGHSVVCCCFVCHRGFFEEGVDDVVVSACDAGAYDECGCGAFET